MQPDATLEQMPGQSASAQGRMLASRFRPPFFLLLGAFALFVLPFAHAPQHPVLSVAYVAGCDNRLAEVGLALLSLAALILAWRADASSAPAGPSEQREQQPAKAPLSRALVVSATALTVLFTLLLGVLIVHSGLRYGEANYFLDRTRNAVEYHMMIYRDLEFPYGPLLLYPGVWLARLLAPLHISVDAAYFLALAATNAAGVLLLAYLADRLPLTRHWRSFLFLFCVAGQLHPLAGPNYSLLKFVAPFALLVWAARRGSLWACGLAMATAHLVVLLISPELGVGMAAGVAAFTAMRLLQREWRFLLLLFSPLLSTSVFFLLFGRIFLQRLGQASGGALNLVPEPSPHLIVFGVAVVWLVPVAVGLATRQRTPDAAVMAGLYMLALGMLPGALGRCDSLHVFFYGVGFVILSMLAAQQLAPRWQRVWACALTLLGLQTQWVNYQLYAPQLATLVTRHAVEPTVDLTLLRAASGDATRIATPVLGAVSLRAELDLRRAGLFVPDYYPGLAEVWDAHGEARKIGEMRAQAWILLPAPVPLYSEPLPNTPVKLAMRFGYRYKERNAPYVLGAMLSKEVKEHWMPVQQFGGLMLYRQRSL